MQLFANNADSSLNGAIASDTAVLVLKAGEGDKFPSPINGDFFLVTLFQKVGTTELNHEIVKCTSRTGDNLTVVRAQEGTSARSFNSGDLVELRITKGSVERFTQSDELAVPRLNSLLVYYGYPIAYKGIWNADAIVAEISASHDYWVVGHTYQDPAREEYASTVAIMRGVRAAGVKLYGYIPLGTNSYNYTVAQIEAITDQWMAIGVDGIFIDEYGFDYGNTRQRQVDVVNMIHTKGLPICANAWVMEEFVTDSLAETGWPSGDWRYVRWQEWNPTNIPSPAQPGDSYLFENFCYNHLGPTVVWDTQERAERTRALALQNAVSVWGVAVFAETTPGTLDTAKLGNLATLPAAGEYISANAYLYDINVVGSGGFSFGSNGTPLWAPLRQLSESAQLPARPAENNYTDKTGVRSFGPVRVKVTNTATIQAVEVRDVTPLRLGGGNIALDKATLGLGNVDNTRDSDKAVLSATKLTAARTINGVSFDGTTNISIEDATKEPVVAVGAATQYFRGDKSWRDFFTDVRAATLTGLSTATSAVVAATDTVLAAIGKLQAQVSAKFDKTGGDISGSVNVSGDLLATSGTLGYGAGSGGTVWQWASVTASVTLNTPNGVISLADDYIYAGDRIEFTLYNSLISPEFIVIAHGVVDDGASYSTRQLAVRAEYVEFGKAVISVKNISAFTAPTNSVKIRFVVFAGSNS